ncbi:polysaccharide pyruvyl transferase family protein [Myroides odoratimimus]|uniref:polysaccharide pyruvyl transferase family protein n=1 Tax=Myroides odoratimimus TaxID=76832 RepID=UPI002DC03F83|nr:polysaccharide pyruvyl transferase family protein [Myroides odoratimimus]MEC4086893.1 polysaccharide pyruvyl transferase family protein [Myroides odoratimimus]
MKVLLKFYSELNLGDDLFLKLILERYPTVDFYLLSDDRYSRNFVTENSFKNLKIFNDKSDGFLNRLKGYLVRRLLKNKVSSFYKSMLLKTNIDFFKQCDMFISIGGSIFMEKPLGFFDQDILYYKVIREYFDKKAIFFIGCNFGPFSNVEYLKEYKEIFGKAGDVCFRDNYSFNLFKNIESVRIAPDIVFSLKSFDRQNKIRNSVGFSVITTRDLLEEDIYLDKYIKIIKRYLEKEQSVYLFSFCEKEGDEIMIKRLLENFKSSKNVIGVFYRGNIKEFLNIYAKVEFMYCSRFHSMILSMLFEQNIHPIVYSEKMINVLNDISYKGTYTQLKDFVNIDVNAKDHFIENSYNIEDIKIEAEKHFLNLDKTLS